MLKRAVLLALPFVIALLFVSWYLSDSRDADIKPATPSAELAGEPRVLVQALATARVGDEVRVSIVAKDVKDVAGVQATLAYDPNVLTLNRVEEGDFLRKGNGETLRLDVTDTTTPGIVKDIVIVRLSETAAEGEGVFANVYFTAKAPGTSALTLPNLLVGKSDASLLPVEISAAQITVR